MHMLHTAHPPNPRIRHYAVCYAAYTLAGTRTPYAANTPHSASIVMHTELYNRNRDNGEC